MSEQENIKFFANRIAAEANDARFSGIPLQSARVEELIDYAITCSPIRKRLVDMLKECRSVASEFRGLSEDLESVIKEAEGASYIDPYSLPFKNMAK